MNIDLTTTEQVVIDTAIKFFLAEVKRGAAGTMQGDDAVCRSILAKLATS